jgi:hypothetical protein
MNLKKSIFCALLISVFALMSCSDDDSSDSQTSSIIGEWSLSNVELVSITMGGMDITDLLDTPGLNPDDLGFDDIIEDEFDEDFTIEFRADNTVSLNSDDEMEEGTYSINADVLTINSSEEEEAITFIIKTLDDNSLVLTQQEELDFDETDISNPLLTQPVEIEVDLSFNKL